MNTETLDPLDPIDLGQHVADEIHEGADEPKVKKRIDPKAKRHLYIIAGIFAIVIVVGLATCSSKPEVRQSTFIRDPGATGTGLTGKEDRAAAAKAETERVEAMKVGRASGIAQPVGNDAQIDVTPPALPPVPLAATPIEIPVAPQRIQNGPTTSVPQQAVPVAAAAVVDEQRLKAMQSQMTGLMQSWQGTNAGAPDYTFKSKTAAGGQTTSAQQGGAPPGAPAADPVIAPAFETAYAAELMSTIDTDTPGIVRARILTGPLKGAVIVGQAKRLDTGAQVVFSQGYINGGQPFKINAIGIDEATEKDIVDGHYNGKYLQRFAFPIIAEGIRAYTQARAQTGTQVILTSVPTVGSDGIGGNSAVGAVQQPAPTSQQAANAMVAAASNQASRLLQQNDAQPQVVVDMHSTFGVLLTAPIRASEIPAAISTVTGAEATPVGRPSLVAPTQYR